MYKYQNNENDNLFLEFDWIGISRNINLVVGLNGNVKYFGSGGDPRDFTPDINKDISLTLEDAFNQNYPFDIMRWFGVGIAVERGEHYSLPVGGLHKWQPNKVQLVANFPCLVRL